MSAHGGQISQTLRSLGLCLVVTIRVLKLVEVRVNWPGHQVIKKKKTK